MNRRLVAGAFGTVSLVALSFMGGCSGGEGVAPNGRSEAAEAPIDPNVTYYVVAFHWGWGVFDSEGRELDGINVVEGTAVELIAVNDAADEAIDLLPARVAAAINAVEWDGDRTRDEVAAGRLPDPELQFGLRLEDVMGHGDDGHDDDEEAADGGHVDDEDGADGGHDEGEEVTDGGHDDDEDGAEGGHDDGEEAADSGHDDDEEAADGRHDDDEEASDGGHDDDEEAAGDGEHDDSPIPTANLAAWQTPWIGEQRELETHGFLVPWYGSVARLEPDATEPFRTVFIVDRPGAFEFVCTVYCGFGHQYQPREMLFVQAAQS